MTPCRGNLSRWNHYVDLRRGCSPSCNSRRLPTLRDRESTLTVLILYKSIKSTTNSLKTNRGMHRHLYSEQGQQLVKHCFDCITAFVSNQWNLWGWFILLHAETHIWLLSVDPCQCEVDWWYNLIRFIALLYQRKMNLYYCTAATYLYLPPVNTGSSCCCTSITCKYELWHYISDNGIALVKGTLTTLNKMYWYVMETVCMNNTRVTVIIYDCLTSITNTKQ